jgi:hypothetical protein
MNPKVIENLLDKSFYSYYLIKEYELMINTAFLNILEKILMYPLYHLHHDNNIYDPLPTIISGLFVPYNTLKNNYLCKIYPNLFF